MKTLQPIHTIILTLVLLVVGTLGFALQAYAVEPCECEFALYTYEEPSGTYGNKLPAYIWGTRTINTDVMVQGSSISRSGNEITLQPGTYYIHVQATIERGAGKLRLRTTDDTTTLAVGIAYGAGVDFGMELRTYLVVHPDPITFRIEHYNPYKSAFEGKPSGGSEPEVYLTLHIIKVTDEKCH